MGTASKLTAVQSVKKVDKLPRIPKNARIHKRPLMHPQISSPYAGRTSEKVVYISAATPFMSAMKRVQQLLDHIRKRDVQAELSRQSKPGSRWKTDSKIPPKSTPPEPVFIKATGKAIDKALRLALSLQAQANTSVTITTNSADAIDDIVPSQDSSSSLADFIGRKSSSGAGTTDENALMGNTSDKVAGPPDDPPALPLSRIRHASVIQIVVTRR